MSAQADVEKGVMSYASSAASSATRAEDLGLAPMLSENIRQQLADQGVDMAVAKSLYEADDPLMLRRVQTAMSIQREILGSKGALIATTPLPPFGGGKPYPPMPRDRECYTVDFDGSKDPEFPQNWPMHRKAPIMAGLGFATMTAAFGSAVFASATNDVAAAFHMPTVVSLLSVSLYVLGFASGPLLWAPLSELFGRRQPLMLSTFGFAVFSVAVATAKDKQTIFICRFFSGFFGACSLAVVPAVFADIFGNRTRGMAMACFAACVFAGPLIAPICGGFITASYLGWRWTEYLTSIMAFAAFIFIVFFIEETYPPMILVHKAAELRQRTGNWGIHARQEQVEMSVKDLVEKNLSRPVKMLASEPILLLITIYVSFIYGILYLLLEAYPIIFVEGYGMSPSVGMLPYIGLIVGQLTACGIAMAFEPYTYRLINANGGLPVPEARLIPTMIGAIVFPIGLFWLCWSGAYPQSVHWIVPSFSGLFTGAGIILLFLSAINYIVESYMVFAASAMAANTVFRSAFGAGFPLFAAPLFHNLGIQWAGTLLALISVLLVPVPFLFYKYGRQIRGRSRYALK
ncbi:major facilitator superfamily domain-containing protein [Dipodascopsis tothii]|uniref:major facilitator superfamily domain-containing protein n=1 Tax=Dipodascopsis tothii TaxID=44089 RepID=UPI0034CDA57C